jgi:hypothetical protein
VSGTITQFAPSSTQPQQFQAVLTDAVLGTATYNCTVKWNTFGQRWYVEITDQNGNLILNKPLIASPTGYNISLVGGYFSGSTMVFLEATQQFVVAP